MKIGDNFKPSKCSKSVDEVVRLMSTNCYISHPLSNRRSHSLLSCGHHQTESEREKEREMLNQKFESPEIFINMNRVFYRPFSDKTRVILNLNEVSRERNSRE